MPTSIEGGSGAGTDIQTGATGGVFAFVQITFQDTTATYPDAPTDLSLPGTDLVVIAKYATGEYVFWLYDSPEDQWVALEGAPVV